MVLVERGRRLQVVPARAYCASHLTEVYHILWFQRGARAHCDDSPAPAPEWSLNGAIISRPLIDLNRALIELSLISTPFSTAHFAAHL